MLTIDHIVEKYRSLGSEATIAANLRRSGMSAEGIKKSLAQHREWRGTVAEQEQQIAIYRAGLIDSSRAEQITAYLSLFGSFEVPIPLWEETVDERADVFWSVFLESWKRCDGLWPLRKILLETFLRRRAELSPIGLMTPADRAFYDELPDIVTVFRGCTRRRVRGLPWTTDLGRAEFFARGGRLGRQRDPVIARAEIAKSDLFFVSTARQESEVVLDPYLIKRLRLEPVAA